MTTEYKTFIDEKGNEATFTFSVKPPLVLGSVFLANGSEYGLEVR